jgi:chromosome segregation ATPase
VPPPSAELAELAGQHEEELQALHSKLSQVQSELSEVRREALQARSRIKTQDKLYLAMRGELEAKKDRLKQQQEELERLLAMRATLLGASGPATGSDGRGDSLESVEAEARGQGGEVEPAVAEASPADS